MAGGPVTWPKNGCLCVCGAGMEFRYKRPGNNFDANKVYGPVATLVRVTDPAAALALEVAAGGKLHQVMRAPERPRSCRKTHVLLAYQAELGRRWCLSLFTASSCIQCLVLSTSQCALGCLQVVVEDDTTAKDLLSKGQLQRRTTIIPLNKVRAL